RRNMSGNVNVAQRPGLLQRYRQRFPWLDHLVRAGQTYLANHGDHYAAAITFFSVLSLVPLLMMVFAVAGIVLAGDQQLFGELQEQIKKAAPQELGETLNEVITTAIESRHSVGIIGLLLALYSGLGWMGNLREALTVQWGQRHEAEGIVRTAAVDLLALFGLGLALIVSFGITGAGTAFTGALLDLAGLGDMSLARLMVRLLAVALSLTGMWLVFLWVIARLPREPVTWRKAMRAAALAAIGFELLKQVFASYLDSVTTSPTGVLFGPVIGLMVFAYFVSRFLLFITAWAATAKENLPPTPSAPSIVPTQSAPGHP
ncbi:MAG: inner membrane protein YhjD, partial [Pseudonocardiaceae bacterium]